MGDVIHVTLDADWIGDPKSRWSMSDGVLAVGPCLTVLHWSVTQATASLSSAESAAKAITKGCIEALYVKRLLEHQTARLFKIEFWTDSSSAKAIMQRLGLGAERNTCRCRRFGLNSWTRSVSSRWTNWYAVDVSNLLTKHVQIAVVDKLAGMMGYTLFDEGTQKFQESRASIRSIGTRNWQQLRDCQYSTMERTNSRRMMFTVLRTKRLISRQPFWGGVLRWKSYNNHIYTDHRDLLSYVTVLWQFWENVGKTRRNREVQSSLSICPRWRGCSLPLVNASRRIFFFSLFVPHVWCSWSVRVVVVCDAQSLFVVCARYTYLLY